jgi:hypothetical protein
MSGVASAEFDKTHGSHYISCVQVSGKSAATKRVFGPIRRRIRFQHPSSSPYWAVRILLIPSLRAASYLKALDLKATRICCKAVSIFLGRNGDNFLFTPEDVTVTVKRITMSNSIESLN